MSVQTAKDLRTDYPEVCRTCGAEIVWRKNDVTERPAPIDAMPTLNGNIEVIDKDWYRVISTQTLFDQRQSEEPVLHLNHFVTCENPPRRK